ncbi:uncharacterized protein [Argopecten irradians]|uniref:uncharacterized protein isoform X2 n=1 Tax=Argopecten irradians TaxID=31199 RepID=UPI00372057E1
MSDVSFKPTLDGYTGEEHPEVYDTRAIPKTTAEPKVGQLSQEDVRKFFEDGYVLVKDVFSNEKLEACKNAINQMADDLAQKLYKAGKITDLCSDSGFSDRLIKLEKQFPGANVLFIKQAKMTQAFRDLWTDDALLNIIEQLIGPDIAGSPVWNLRAKVPRDEATTVPWHQDYDRWSQIREGSNTPVLSWRHVVCHVGGGRDGENISLDNISDHIRWSVDLRWQSPNHPYGYYNLKDGVVFRTKDDPNHVVDWDTFDGVDRFQVTNDAVTEKPQEAKEAEFDTSIQGPWMKKWEIVHINKHVLKMHSEEKSA